MPTISVPSSEQARSVASIILIEPTPAEPHASLLGSSRFFKRSLDIFGASMGLLLLSPILLLVMLAIKLDSPGPVIFRQRRVGLNGKDFEMYKFRSMTVDAEARQAELWALNEMKDGPIFKLKNDPRITRVGRFIRRTSLDEFPQLVNILLGQMSLVGPRPPLPSEVVHYTPEQHQRLSVVPGATGLWQVSGRSGIDSFKTMVHLDLEYIRNWSLRSDWLILFKTVRVMLKMEGSC